MTSPYDTFRASGGSLLLSAAAILLATAPPSAAPANYTAFDTGLYLAVVYPLEDAGLQRAANRSLASLQLQFPFPVTPLYTPFPSTATFPGVLESLCRKWEGRTVVGALVLAGSGGLVLATALATGGVGVPMLWLSQTAFVQEPMGDHVVRIGPSERGLVWALRSLLLTSKWHSFHLLYGGPLSGLDHDKLKWLRQPPLSPIVHRLNPASVNMRIMKSLSHSSRGVVVVMGDILAAAAILDKATSLGLTGSGLVWIWADTGEVVSAPPPVQPRPGGPVSGALIRSRRAQAPRLEIPTRLPVGLLALKAMVAPLDRHLVRAGIRLMVEAMRRAAINVTTRLGVASITRSMWRSATSCSADRTTPMANFTEQLVKELKKGVRASQTGRVLPLNDTTGMRTLAARYLILNLVPELTESFTQEEQQSLPRSGIQVSNNWKQVGDIMGCCDVRLERIIWPGGSIGGPCGGPRGKIKVVTAVAAPFVMTSDVAREAGRDSCLRGVPCQMVSDFNGTRYTYKVSCCYGLSMDLLEAVAQELDLDFTLYMVPDTMFGSRVTNADTGVLRWTGVVGDLIAGHADMAFTALSVSRPRSEVIDFSGPYYFSGVSFLAAPNQQTDIPLLAFLLPFSTELWIAIFTSLNVTAIAVAIYEWLSPFGLNPWGRQRTKNFSMSSALWVCWGLLCGHLVAFKAPKSWPNKFLINVWGGFSVIFVASYTANIAALIAGLFFHSATATYHDNSLLWQRVGTPKGSASEYYVHKANQMLWEHMQRFHVPDVATGVQYLKNGTLDILIADTPILDYYRATDPGCKLQKIGDTINEDTYAIGMTKGFPLKDSVSSVIAKFTSNGYMDILQEKWYGGLACFSMDMDMSQPKPLGVTAVAGVFMLLGMGVVVGLVILIVEHLFYRYTLPILRHKPKGTIWRSRNIMFFSQKLYRFINCVELVSPHHAARELVHTIRQGQITSLFQKSVKRKEHEQRRRRKSKAQFFEMIQEIRRVQQEEKQNSQSLSDIEGAGGSPKRGAARSPNIYGTADRTKRVPSRLELARRFSKDVFRSKSSSNLDARKFSSDINFAASRFFEAHSSQAIGRRLSRDTNLSPPDINSRRASHLVLTPELSVASSEGLENAPKSPYLSLPHQRTLSASYNHHSSFSSGSSTLGKQLSLQEHTLAAATSRGGEDRLAPSNHLPASKQSSLGERSSASSSSSHQHHQAVPQHYQTVPQHHQTVPQQHHMPKQTSLQERPTVGFSHSMPKQTSLQEPPPEINVHPPPTPRRVTSLSGAPLGLPPPHPPKRAIDNQKFSYVDTTSPSFRERISKYAEEANNTIQMSAEERRRHAPSLLEQISSMQEQFPTKPKIIAVKPKVPPRDGIPALRQVQSADGDPNVSTRKRTLKDKNS